MNVPHRDCPASTTLETSCAPSNPIERREKRSSLTVLDVEGVEGSALLTALEEYPDEQHRDQQECFPNKLARTTPRQDLR